MLLLANDVSADGRDYFRVDGENRPTVGVQGLPGVARRRGSVARGAGIGGEDVGRVVVGRNHPGPAHRAR